MIKAQWAGTTLAASTDTVMVEGNQYFPRKDVQLALLVPSDHVTHCGWKGEAHYYHVVIDGERNDNAAWYYPDPLTAAKHIRDHIAFWHGVQVQ